MKNIVFTGGHHNSALVIAKNLKKLGYHIIWMGHKHTMKGEDSLSFEYHEVVRSGIEFIELKTGKFYRPSHFDEWLKIPGGIFQAWKVLKKYKADLVVAFGGYLSSPVVIAAWLQRIPSFIHEQTTVAGWANRLNSFFAKKVFITWPESYQYFSPSKTVLVGLPLRPSHKNRKIEKLTDFDNNLPTLLILGGKQGSHIINLTVSKIYSRLLENYNIIHQTGGLKKTNDYYNLLALKKKLPEKQADRLLLRKYLFEANISRAFSMADLVICRAGAHTVYELISIGKPALLVPLALSMTSEQMSNANKAKDLGLAEILQEVSLSPQSLELKIEEMLKKIDEYKKAGAKAKKLAKTDAAKIIVDYVKKSL